MTKGREDNYLQKSEPRLTNRRLEEDHEPSHGCLLWSANPPSPMLPREVL